MSSPILGFLAILALSRFASIRKYHIQIIAQKSIPLMVIKSKVIDVPIS